MGSYEPSLGRGGAFLLCDVPCAPPNNCGGAVALFCGIDGHRNLWETLSLHGACVAHKKASMIIQTMPCERMSQHIKVENRSSIPLRMDVWAKGKHMHR